MRDRWRNFENTQSEKAIVGSASNPKKVSMLTWFVLALTIVVLCPVPNAVAQEPGESAPVGQVAADSKKALPPPKEWYEEPTKNLFTLALGGQALAIKSSEQRRPRPTALVRSPPQASRSRPRITGTSHTGSAATSISAESLEASFLTTKVLEIHLNLRPRRSQAISMRGCGMWAPASSS